MLLCLIICCASGEDKHGILGGKSYNQKKVNINNNVTVVHYKQIAPQRTFSLHSHFDSILSPRLVIDAPSGGVQSKSSCCDLKITECFR